MIKVSRFRVALAPAVLTAALACGEGPLPVARIDRQVASAGTAVGDTLRLTLHARMARWYPAADTGASIVTAAFGETADSPRVPAPLIRVATGTILAVTVHNGLTDTLLVVGLGGAEGAGADTLTVAPRGQAGLQTVLRAPGTYAYAGLTSRSGTRTLGGPGQQLFGALVVDSAGVGPVAPDRVMVLKAWNGPAAAGTADPHVMTINGKTWPHTERLDLNVGDTLRLRVVNGSDSEHPMHLHGFYFRVDARGTWHRDSALAPIERHLAVTETLRRGETMSLTWVAERPGNWLFHCHVAGHIDPVQHYDLAGLPRPGPATLHHDGPDHAATAMAGLVVGIRVRGPEPVSESGPARAFRIVVREHPAYFADGTAAQSYHHEPTEPATPGPPAVPGPPLVLTRGERTAVTVVNRLGEPTSVHWHGIELESYYDGVPGWSGNATRLAPLLQPGDSFVAVMTPPRTGTFIYHTHASEPRQLSAGLVAPLLVLEPGARRDPARDHLWVLHVAGVSDSAPVMLNGGRPVTLRAGLAHRIRLIVITASDEADIELLDGERVVAWRALAKDGADLPPSRQRAVPARLHAGPGETFDFEWRPSAGRYRLRVRSFNDFEVPVVVR